MTAEERRTVAWERLDAITAPLLEARRFALEVTMADLIDEEGVETLTENGTVEANFIERLEPANGAAFRGALDAVRAEERMAERRRLAAVLAEWRANGTWARTATERPLGVDVALGDLVASLLATDY